MPLAARQDDNEREPARRRAAARRRRCRPGSETLEPRRLLSLAPTGQEEPSPPVFVALEAVAANAPPVELGWLPERVVARREDLRFELDGPGRVEILRRLAEDIEEIGPTLGLSWLAEDSGLAIPAWEAVSVEFEAPPFPTEPPPPELGTGWDPPPWPLSSTPVDLPADRPVVIVDKVGRGEPADLYRFQAAARKYQVRLRSTDPNSAGADHLWILDAAGNVLGDYDLAGWYQAVTVDLHTQADTIDGSLYLAVGASNSAGAAPRSDSYRMELTPIAPFPESPGETGTPPASGGGSGGDLSTGGSNGGGGTIGLPQPGTTHGDDTTIPAGWDDENFSEGGDGADSSASPGAGQGAGPIPAQVASPIGGAAGPGALVEWLDGREVAASGLVTIDFEPGREPDPAAEDEPIEVAVEIPAVVPLEGSEPLGLLAANHAVALLEPEERAVDVEAALTLEAAAPELLSLALADAEATPLRDVNLAAEPGPGSRPIVKAGIGLAAVVVVGYLLPDLAPLVRPWRRRWLRRVDPPRAR